MVQGSDFYAKFLAPLGSLRDDSGAIAGLKRGAAAFQTSFAFYLLCVCFFFFLTKTTGQE